jgi:glutathione peroxidase
MNKIRFIFAAAALAALAACQEKTADGPAQPPAAAVEAEVKVEKGVTGKTAAKPGANAAAKPAAYQKKDTYFKVPAVTGGELDLAAYSGKPVLFMLFTETCPYCRKAAPALEKLHKTYAAKGLAVAGLCIQDNPQAAVNFAADLGVTFSMGYAAREVYRQYKAQGVPYIYLLNKAHEPVAVWPGFDRSFEPQMTKAIEAELAS